VFPILGKLQLLRRVISLLLLSNAVITQYNWLISVCLCKDHIRKEHLSHSRNIVRMLMRK